MHLQLQLQLQHISEVLSGILGALITDHWKCSLAAWSRAFG